MSLATRCPACGTVFRVVRDQLKVSEGWVRCGRCSEVFNAGQRLFDLERERSALVALPSRHPGPARPQSKPTPAAPAESGHAGLAPLSAAAARVNTAWVPPSRPAVLWAPESNPVPLTAPPTATDDVEAGARGEARADKAAQPAADAATPSSTNEAAGATAWRAAQPAPMSAHPAALPEAARAAEPAARGESPSAAGSIPQSLPQSLPESIPQAVQQAADDPQPTPEFVLRADRDARWRHPARRSTLAMLSLLLAALLAAQMALHYRDGLAAGWPAFRPWLQAACNALGCRIEAPRRIDSLSVDSSGLVRVEGSALYRLSLVVQNKAATPVRMPAIELALTDTQGQTMARRVLLPAELGQPAESLPARGEVALQAMLELGERRVAGYTVELFYP